MSAALKKLLHAVRDAEGADWQHQVKAFLKDHKLSAAEKKGLGLSVYEEVLKQATANLHIDPEEAQALAAVKAYFKLADKDIQEVKRHYAPKALKMMLEWFLIDGILTPSEEAQLIAFGKEMMLTEKEIEAFLTDKMPKK